MGLAASQARFLAITSRKMNCEFQSMQVAQEKLSVTRDLQRAAQIYQSSLDAKKLVWDTEDGDVYDLSYNIMMTPTNLNEYSPYLVTDTQGKIVLSPQMFDAAKNAGIIDTNGNPISEPNRADRDKFLRALGAYNLADGVMIEKIINKGDDGYTLSGIGGVIYDKTKANAMNIGMFTSYLKEATYELSSTLPTGKSTSDPLYGTDIGETLKLESTNAFDNFHFNISDIIKQNKDLFAITKSDGASTLSKEQIKKLTLGDLLAGNYQLVYATNTGDSNYYEKFQKILDEFAKTLGYGFRSSADCQNPTDSKGLNVDALSDMALDIAYDLTKELLNKSSTIDGDEKDASKLAKKAQQCNTIVESSDQKTYSLSLSNMLKSFLTYFAIAQEGFGVGYSIKKDSVKDSDYVTNDYSYYFVLSNDAAITDETLLNADFYNMLYNQIAMNGCCTDKNKQELVTDNKYLKHALQNGQLFISSLHNDGYFYQGAYTLSSHVAEVNDEDAIARAELDYNVTKSKLNYKEETLELKMKNLDMEISALTTEFDTVKNLISKNVEKVFTMFSN